MGPSGFRTIAIQTILDPKNAPNVKQFFVTDGDGDPVSIYTVQSAAQAGDPCLEQVLVYNTISGNKFVEKIAWRTATWSGASWDI